MLQILNPDITKSVCFWAKYIGLLCTGCYSIFNLRADTYDAYSKELTPNGKIKRLYIVLATVAIFVVAGVENWADKELQKKASLEGDQKFVQHLQESNDRILGKLIPSLNQLQSTATTTRTELQNSASILKNSSDTLEHSIKSVVPLKILDFTAQLSDWIEIGGDMQADSLPSKAVDSPYSQKKTSGFTRVKVKSAEWRQLVCTQHDEEWSIRMNITDVLQLIVKSPGAIVKIPYSSQDVCRLQTYSRTGSIALGYQDTQLWSAADENENTVFVRQMTRRPELSESFQKEFHINAIDSVEQQSFAVRVHTLQGSNKYNILLPLHITAHIRASAEGVDKTIEKSWRLDLDPHPLSSGALGNLAWYAYYSAGKKSKKPLLYVNE
ncbi:MAG TPA: hypothetical protein VFK06_15570 [Candidatus Angelobacter sp.]|nr:hypothetical protein [Candidatus Angelobacter sp.]